MAPCCCNLDDGQRDLSTLTYKRSRLRAYIGLLICLQLGVGVGCQGTIGGANAPRTTGNSSPHGPASEPHDAARVDAGSAEPSPPSVGAVDAGSAAEGGAAATSANSTGKSMNPPAPPAVVHDCSGLGAKGEFQNITPPDIKSDGPFAIAVDPVNHGTMYCGTVHQGVYKTTDCGASWTRIATGKLGAQVSSGMNWTLVVDPIEPNVVYTNSGYGSNGNGLYKSINGGVDFETIWPPEKQPEIAKAFMYNFANVIALDPLDHHHILLTFHEECLAPHPKTCIAESEDGGASWRLLDGESSWAGNEGQVIFFMETSSAWLWGSQSSGFWRSTDSGKSWKSIKGMTTTHLQGSQLARAQNGAFYMAGSDGVWRSPTGDASDWKLIDGTGPIGGGMIATGKNLYSVNCYFEKFCAAADYFTAPESDGTKWSKLPSPKLGMGGTMAYDVGHKLLYSSNGSSGLWRVVLE